MSGAVLCSACYVGIDFVDDDAQADGGSDDSAADSGADGGEEELGPYAEPRLRVLLGRQYVNAVTDLLGPAAGEAVDPRTDVALNGFVAVGASQLALSDDDIDRFESSARAAAAAARAADTLGDFYSCEPVDAADSNCMTEFVADFGYLAWRRPLDDAELTRWVAVGVEAAVDLGDFETGLEFVVAGMLQSPYFVYQVERGEPVADLGAAGVERRALQPHELATRMAFFLTDSTPSRELLAAAEAGELDDEAGVRAWALELMDHPRSQAALEGYFAELLHIDHLEAVAKDGGTYPGWSPALAESMRGETLALVSEVIWEEGRDFRDILDADYTYVDEALANHYGVAYPGPSGFQRVALPEGQKRGGILGHAGLMSSLSHVDSTSPTIRGKFVQERLLCFTIPPPPPGVVTDLPSTEEAKTMRERLALHQQEPECAGCHSIMDPPGLGLENFDGVGRYRELDNGEPIDALSDLDGDSFEGSGQLGSVIRERPRFTYCSVANLYRHATGHIESGGEVDSLLTVDDAFSAEGHAFRALLVELVASDAFRLVGELQ